MHTMHNIYAVDRLSTDFESLAVHTQLGAEGDDVSWLRIRVAPVAPKSGKSNT